HEAIDSHVVACVQHLHRALVPVGNGAEQSFVWCSPMHGGPRALFSLRSAASSGTSIFLWSIRQMLLGRRARRERRGASRPDRRAGRRDRRARRTPARVMNRAGLGANWFPRLRPRAGFSLLGVPPPRQIATASELSVFARLRPALPCC